MVSVRPRPCSPAQKPLGRGRREGCDASPSSASRHPQGSWLFVSRSHLVVLRITPGSVLWENWQGWRAPLSGARVEPGSASPSTARLSPRFCCRSPVNSAPELLSSFQRLPGCAAHPCLHAQTLLWTLASGPMLGVQVDLRMVVLPVEAWVTCLSHPPRPRPWTGQVSHLGDHTQESVPGNVTDSCSPNSRCRLKDKPLWGPESAGSLSPSACPLLPLTSAPPGTWAASEDMD